VTDYFEIRPWRPDDLDLLGASESLFAPATYPRRFLAGNRPPRSPHLQVSERRCDAVSRWMGQIALHENQVVAVAECAWEPAELESPTLAVSVAQAWQHTELGGTDLGGTVLGQLVVRCLSLGITTFNLDYAASDVPLQTMVDSVKAETGARFRQSAATSGRIGLVTVQAVR
jgi:hypothetical protein